MRKSGYRTILYSYIIFFLVLFCLALTAIGIFLSLINVQHPNGKSIRSDWPQNFMESFIEQIIFIDNKPQIKQSGLEKLRENQLWIQILDSYGNRVYGFSEPKNHKNHYSNSELLELAKKDTPNADTVYLSTIKNNEDEFIYIIHFPLNISKVTMFFDGTKFIGGKPIVLSIIGIIFLIVLISGIAYGYWVTKFISRITSSVSDIAKRTYLPTKAKGAFADVYDSLNTLNEEIHISDEMKKKTDIIREEWISNITHDLKTPLSPIKGYAEILVDTDNILSYEQVHKYASIMLKNIEYTNTLISDLKLTYQLENGIIPLNKQNSNLIRFLKELAIDILNYPEYGTNTIEFDSNIDNIKFTFDSTLLKRAFSNLIINAFMHGNQDTKVSLNVMIDDKINITVLDNGKGMTEEEVSNLFNRYYRGTNTEQKTEGTGLGLAITKQIIELHRGTISVESILSLGTTFHISFPIN
ncbi:sensor histidine kinase [Clostridioides sp. ES-S-0001-03]|uniref:sensor histidine kinase n=1 Tax=Clostridioides sp. ES-S-0001-03 TaxID=2770771 RepID=UPI001D0CC9F9|nr:HAMP domain-containing histidine kinase [Clostridioides sp. ES-S-0001-03]